MRIGSGLATVVAVAALSACGSGSLPLLPSAGGAGPGGVAEDSRSSAMSAMPYFSVHYSLSPDFKDELPDTATAYELSRKTDANAVFKLARALGVEGEPLENDEDWLVTADGRTVRVAKHGGLPFSLDGDMAVSSGYACAEPASPTEPAPDGSPTRPRDYAAKSNDPAVDSTRCAAPPRNPDLPTQAAAEKIARDALSAAGLDLDGAKVTADGGYDSWNVTVAHRVGDTTTSGVTSTVLVGPKGRIQSAYGMLGRPKALGDYPLVSAREAVERLNKMQQGGDLRGGPEPAMGKPEPAMGATGSGASDPGQTEPTLIAPVPDAAPAEQQTREVELTKATTTLMMVGGYEPRSALHLVPAFMFTGDGGDVLVEAATDEHIRPPARDLPADAPKPVDPDTGSGGGGGSDGDSCTGSASATDAPNGAGPPNAPLELEVCVSDGKVRVGQPVTFRVTAKDSDGSFVDGPCEAPLTARFGDEGDGGETATCMACAQATEGKHEHAETLKHTFSKPGKYNVDITAHSGSTCDPRPGDSKGAVTVSIEVTA